MRSLRFALRSFGREIRSGEVLVLLAAVALAVAALTAVGFLTDRIGKAVARQANEVLAADLRLRSQEPIPATWSEMAESYDLQTAETTTFPSVVFAGDLSALATIKAVSSTYPLRGAVRTADALFGEQHAVDGIPARGEAWADGERGQLVALDAAVTFAPVGSIVVDALRAVAPGGTVAINAIHLDRIPEFGYAREMAGLVDLTRLGAILPKTITPTARPFESNGIRRVRFVSNSASSCSNAARGYWCRQVSRATCWPRCGACWMGWITWRTCAAT